MVSVISCSFLDTGKVNTYIKLCKKYTVFILVIQRLIKNSETIRNEPLWTDEMFEMEVVSVKLISTVNSTLRPYSHRNDLRELNQILQLPHQIYKICTVQTILSIFVQIIYSMAVELAKVYDRATDSLLAVKWWAVWKKGRRILFFMKPLRC